MALLPAVQSPPPAHHCLNQKKEVFACGIEVEFSRRGHQRVPMQDDNSLAPFFGQRLESLAQIQLLTGKELIVESTDFPERGCLAKNERPRDPA